MIISLTLQVNFYVLYFERSILRATESSKMPNIFLSVLSGSESDSLEPKYEPTIKKTASIKANLIFT
jgi:hypothetical protein